MTHETGAPQAVDVTQIPPGWSLFAGLIIALAALLCFAELFARRLNYPAYPVVATCIIEWSKTALATVFVCRAIASTFEKALTIVVCVGSSAAAWFCDFGITVVNVRMPFLPVILWCDVILASTVVVALSVGSRFGLALAIAPRHVGPALNVRQLYLRFTLKALLGAVVVCACLCWAFSRVEIGVTTSPRRVALLVALAVPCAFAISAASVMAFARRFGVILVMAAAIFAGVVTSIVPSISKDPFAADAGTSFMVQSASVVSVTGSVILLLRARGWHLIEHKADTENGSERFSE